MRQAASIIWQHGCWAFLGSCSLQLCNSVVKVEQQVSAISAVAERSIRPALPSNNINSNASREPYVGSPLYGVRNITRGILAVQGLQRFFSCEADYEAAERSVQSTVTSHQLQDKLLRIKHPEELQQLLLQHTAAFDHGSAAIALGVVSERAQKRKKHLDKAAVLEQWTPVLPALIRHVSDGVKLLSADEACQVLCSLATLKVHTGPSLAKDLMECMHKLDGLQHVRPAHLSGALWAMVQMNCAPSDQLLLNLRTVLDMQRDEVDAASIVQATWAYQQLAGAGSRPTVMSSTAVPAATMTPSETLSSGQPVLPTAAAPAPPNLQTGCGAASISRTQLDAEIRASSSLYGLAQLLQQHGQGMRPASLAKAARSISRLLSNSSRCSDDQAFARQLLASVLQHAAAHVHRMRCEEIADLLSTCGLLYHQPDQETLQAMAARLVANDGRCLDGAAPQHLVNIAWALLRLAGEHDAKLVAEVKRRALLRLQSLSAKQVPQLVRALTAFHGHDKQPISTTHSLLMALAAAGIEQGNALMDSIVRTKCTLTAVLPEGHSRPATRSAARDVAVLADALRQLGYKDAAKQLLGCLPLEAQLLAARSPQELSSLVGRDLSPRLTILAISRCLPSVLDQPLDVMHKEQHAAQLTSLLDQLCGCLSRVLSSCSTSQLAAALRGLSQARRQLPVTFLELLDMDLNRRIAKHSLSRASSKQLAALVRPARMLGAVDSRPIQHLGHMALVKLDADLGRKGPSPSDVDTLVQLTTNAAACAPPAEWWPALSPLLMRHLGQLTPAQLAQLARALQRACSEHPDFGCELASTLQSHVHHLPLPVLVHMSWLLALLPGDHSGPMSAVAAASSQQLSMALVKLHAQLGRKGPIPAGDVDKLVQLTTNAAACVPPAEWWPALSPLLMRHLGQLTPAQLAQLSRALHRACSEHPNFGCEVASTLQSHVHHLPLPVLVHMAWLLARLPGDHSGPMLAVAAVAEPYLSAMSSQQLGMIAQSFAACAATRQSRDLWQAVRCTAMNRLHLLGEEDLVVLAGAVAVAAPRDRRLLRMILDQLAAAPSGAGDLLLAVAATWARTGCASPQLWDHLLLAAQPHLHTASAGTLAKLARWSVKARCTHGAGLHAVLEASVCQLHICTPHELAQLVTACCEFICSDHAVVAAMKAALLARVSEVRPEDLALIIRAMARSMHTDVLDALTSAAVRHLDSCSTKAVAMLASSFAGLGHDVPNGFVPALAAAVERQHGQMSVLDLAYCALAFTCWCPQHEQLVMRLAAAAASAVNGVDVWPSTPSPGSLPAALLSIARAINAGVAGPEQRAHVLAPLLSAFLTACRHQPLPEEAAAAVQWALRAGVKDRALLAALGAAAAQCLSPNAANAPPLDGMVPAARAEEEQESTVQQAGIPSGTGMLLLTTQCTDDRSATTADTAAHAQQATASLDEQAGRQQGDIVQPRQQGYDYREHQWAADARLFAASSALPAVYQPPASLHPAAWNDQEDYGVWLSALPQHTEHELVAAA